jgi:hypothetical protein
MFFRHFLQQGNVPRLNCPWILTITPPKLTLKSVLLEVVHVAHRTRCSQSENCPKKRLTTIHNQDMQL